MIFSFLTTPITIGLVIIVLGAVIVSIYLKNTLSYNNGVSKDDINSKTKEDLKFINPIIQEKQNELIKEKEERKLINPVKPFISHEKRQDQFETVLIEQNLKHIENPSEVESDKEVSPSSPPTEPSPMAEVTSENESDIPNPPKEPKNNVKTPSADNIRVSEIKKKCISKIKQISEIQRKKYVA